MAPETPGDIVQHALTRVMLVIDCASGTIWDNPEVFEPMA
jgi:hypothetical protein